MDSFAVADLYQTKSNIDCDYDEQYIHVESTDLDEKGQCGLASNRDGRRKWIQSGIRDAQSDHPQPSG